MASLSLASTRAKSASRSTLAFLPCENRTVIRKSDVPMQPAIAAAAPPPGVGDFLARDSTSCWKDCVIIFRQAVSAPGNLDQERRRFLAGQTAVLHSCGMR